MRIVSLLPSATEIVCLLGLEEQLVGVTHECDYPTSVLDVPKVTSTLIHADASSREIDSLVREQLKTRRALYTLDMPTLQRLQPDLIVTQAVCDVCAVAEEEVRSAVDLIASAPRVVNLEPACLEDVLQCVQRVGEAADCASAAAKSVASLRQRVDVVRTRCERAVKRPRVLLLEWIDPPFCAGHWSPELVRLAGGHEVIGTERTPSRTLSWSEIVEADPDVLFIACCGFNMERTLADLPILRDYPEWSEMRCVQSDNVFVVDGSAYFNRPGPRLVDSLEILAHTLHPDLNSLPNGVASAVRASGNRPLR